MKPLTFSVLTLLTLSSCATPTVTDYAQNKPAFDVRDYLNGDVQAWGMFVDNSGKADPMFHVTLKGAWQGNDGVIEEHFEYNDGHTQDRIWSLNFIDDHHFTGTASDVVGVAKGTQDGNAVQMTYVLQVPTKDGDVHDMTMNDWLFRMTDKKVINRNEMSKFGHKFGELIITFDKP